MKSYSESKSLVIWKKMFVEKNWELKFEKMKMLQRSTTNRSRQQLGRNFSSLLLVRTMGTIFHYLRTATINWFSIQNLIRSARQWLPTLKGYLKDSNSTLKFIEVEMYNLIKILSKSFCVRAVFEHIAK